MMMVFFSGHSRYTILLRALSRLGPRWIHVLHRKPPCCTRRLIAGVAHLRLGFLVLCKTHPRVEFGFLRTFAHKVLRYRRLIIGKGSARVYARRGRGNARVRPIGLGNPILGCLPVGSRVTNLAPRFLPVQIIDLATSIGKRDLSGALFQSCITGFAESCGANLDAFWRVHKTVWEYLRSLDGSSTSGAHLSYQ